MVGGIYRIKNIINNKFYIGSSKNLSRRELEHETKLNQNKHYNKYLQRAWNKYGGEAFVFEYLEEFKIPEDLSSKIVRKLLKNREQYFLDDILHANKSDNVFKTYGYNISRYAEGGDTGNWATGGKHSKHRKVSVFDLDMNFIEEIAGVRATERKYNATVRPCCNGKIKSSKGYIFRYSDKLDVVYIKKTPKKKKIHSNRKKVYEYDLEGNFVREWRCANEASLNTGLTRAAISSNLLNKSKRTKNRIFTYKKPNNELV